MAAVRVIPCLDISNGRIVKGVKFQDLRDAGDPVSRSVAYEAQGGDEVVLLDISATPEQRAHATATVEAVRGAISIPLLVGGGIREVADAARLLEAGADKIGVNSAAVDNPELVPTLSTRYGAQCTIVAVDAARVGSGWRVVVNGGRDRTDLDAVSWCRRVAETGAGEILLTSWDQDGTQAGYDLELVAAVADAVDVPVIASGGAGGAEDLVAAVAAGASATLVASILHDGLVTVAELKSRIASSGVGVRP